MASVWIFLCSILCAFITFTAFTAAPFYPFVSAAIFNIPAVRYDPIQAGRAARQRYRRHNLPRPRRTFLSICAPYILAIPIFASIKREAASVGIAVARCPIGHIATDVPCIPVAHDVATLATFAPLLLSPVGHAGSPARLRRYT